MKVFQVRIYTCLPGMFHKNEEIVVNLINVTTTVKLRMREIK